MCFSAHEGARAGGADQGYDGETEGELPSVVFPTWGKSNQPVRDTQDDATAKQTNKQTK